MRRGERGGKGVRRVAGKGESCDKRGGKSRKRGEESEERADRAERGDG